MHIVVIVNPTSGAGRGARALARMRPALSRHGVTDIRITQRPGDAAALARDALADGAQTIIALGGDGTWSQVATAIARAGSAVPVAFMAGGTGNDFAKTLGLPATDITATLALIERHASRPIDLGRVDDAWFINIAGFGFDAHVVRHMTPRRWIPPRANYAWTAARELWEFRGIGASIGGAPREEFVLIAIANGRHFGGMFPIAPEAAIDDGQLDLITVRDAAPLARIPLVLSALRGAHIRHAATRVSRATAFDVRFDEPPWFQVDGELRLAGGRDVRVEIVTAALRVVSDC